MTWSAPRLADGKGQRYIGDLANVNVSLSGLAANSSVQLQHNGPTTVVGSPIQVGSNGSYAYYDSTRICNNFQSRFYNTSAIDAASQNTITGSDITNLQLISLGVNRLSTAKMLVLEAFFQGINEVNDAANDPLIPRPDVF